MNKILEKKIIETPTKSITSSYCKRNNINEKQFLEAMAWYQSAIKNSNQIINKFTSP